jgi:hypothetical protein
MRNDGTKGYSGSKPSPPPGISATDMQALSNRVAALEAKLREYLDEKNQWNSTVREWIGKEVIISLLIHPEHTESHAICGQLLWIDRYTMCLMVQTSTDASQPSMQPVIIHKAAIATIRPNFKTT